MLIKLDIRNAFNTANWAIILKRLSEIGVSLYLRNIIADYLTDRYVRTTGTRRSTLGVSAGVPQGSDLGPTLWNGLYDPVLRLELVGDMNLIGFADNLAMIVSADEAEDLVIVRMPTLEE